MVCAILFTVSGLAGILFQIMLGVQLVPEVKSWDGSRLWYILFSSDYLDLDIVFFGSVVLFFCGAFLAVWTVYRESKHK